MARVIVTAGDDHAILLSEIVQVCHIDDEHYSVHFLMRLGQAIHDAEDQEAERGIEGARRRIATTPRPHPLRQHELELVVGP